MTAQSKKMSATARLVKVRDSFVVIDSKNTPLSQKYSLKELDDAIEKAKIIKRISLKRGTPSNPAVDALLAYKRTR